MDGLEVLYICNIWFISSFIWNIDKVEILLDIEKNTLLSLSPQTALYKIDCCSSVIKVIFACLAVDVARREWRTRTRPVLQSVVYNKVSSTAGMQRPAAAGGGGPLNLLPPANQRHSALSILALPSAVETNASQRGGGWLTVSIIRITMITKYNQSYLYFYSPVWISTFYKWSWKTKGSKNRDTFLLPGRFACQGIVWGQRGDGTVGEQRLLDWSFETTGLKQLDASDSSAAGGRREACTATCRGTARRRQSLIYSRIMEISLFIYQLVSCNPFLQSKCTNNIDAKWKRTNVFSGKFT